MDNREVLCEALLEFPPIFRKPLGRFLWQVLPTCAEQLPRSLSFILNKLSLHMRAYSAEDFRSSFGGGDAGLRYDESRRSLRPKAAERPKT